MVIIRSFGHIWNCDGSVCDARRRTRRTGGVWTPSPLTRLLGHVATRGKRHSKERQKSLRNCLGHFLGQFIGQITRGHPRSNFAFLTFIYKSTHNSETRRATAPRKGAFDSFFNTLSLRCPQIWPKTNGLAFREQTLKIAVFYVKRFSAITFDSVKAQHSFC